MATDLLERIRAELDARLAELRPAVAEYERLSGATDALGSRAGKPRAARKAAPSRMGPGEQAIVAALEHGSHTVGELGIVTAMAGAEIRDSVRRLLAAGKIVRAKREGRAAYALRGKA
jgi:hypothetical protein